MRLPHSSRGESALRAAADLRAKNVRKLLDQAGLRLIALVAEAAAHDLYGTPITPRWRPVLAVDAIREGLLGPSRPAAKDAPIASQDDWEAEDSLGRNIAKEALREADLARVGLIGAEKELYSEVDRLEAEAEFRIALAPPMLALAGALAWRAAWWTAPIFALVAIVLIVEGRYRRREANDALLEALRAGRTTIPLFDEIDAAVTECRERLHDLNPVADGTPEA